MGSEPRNDAPVVRDAAWVQREYGAEKWARAHAALRQARQGEPAWGRVSRVLAQVVRAELGDPGDRAAVVVDGRLAELPRAAAFGAYQALVVESVLAACTPATERIVELGSGWGRNLVRLWLDGGPRTAEYVAAEYTATGREATDVLAELAPDIRLASLAFDYHAPDLGMLPRVEHAVVFTAHSVEQIPYVKPGLIRCIASIAERVRCLHFEPIGWQDPTSERAGSSAAHADRHDYNRNLLETLREAEAAGTIGIDRVELEVIGVNPHNATSVIAWSAPA